MNVQSGILYLPAGIPGKQSKSCTAFAEVATKKGRPPAQLSLAWLLAKGDNIIPIDVYEIFPKILTPK
ncbi:hypothetical protein [Segetibacter koreensis]|uniref:hypothetical protein n=1 Tax=Segetibacter koreensis TaxID=398037 RepID=UPI000477BFAB|nr:hypothetical protein [Segetibacter koreensis]